jgi:cytochrome b561
MSPTSYTLTARTLHWVMAVLMILMLAAGLVMSDIEDPALKGTIYGLHKATGILVLLLAGFRVLWRLSHAVPAISTALPVWQRRAARLAHGGLYGVMFLLPLSGWSMSSAAGYPVSFYGLFTIPDMVAKNPELAGILKDIHEVSANVFIALLAAHLGAALYHHFILRDDTLRRMGYRTPPK